MVETRLTLLPSVTQHDFMQPWKQRLGRINQMLSVLQDNQRIVLALILQDARTRFGGSYLSYGIAVAWPLVHGGFMILGYVLVNRIAPVGDDPGIFAATGIIPYVLCFYPGRMMPFSFLMNKKVLGLPIIKPIHLICATIIIELVTGIIVTIIIYSVFVFFGSEIYPMHPITALSSVGVTLYLAIGIGVMNITLTALIGPVYMMVYVGIMILMYLTAGVYIPSWIFSSDTVSYFEYNPLFVIVQWTRSAYYDSYEFYHINIPTVLWVATIALFIGLLGERFLRNSFYTN